jgi:4-amino-4-deoxy-L-arabinose transferase-like glycosyltransferase
MNKSSKSARTSSPVSTISQQSKWWIVGALLGLMFFAFIIRIFWITKSPRGALIDEAHFGYLAYSLIKTGKDEHGIPWPIVFKGFGDQKLPAYAYSLIPFVAWLGLSNFTIRIPSLIAGVLLVPAMYWLMRALGAKQNWSIFAVFLIVINPWPFFLSRFGFESNLALCFFTFGLTAMVYAVTKKSVQWSVGAGVLMALTWYSYIAYRPVTVLLALIFLGILWWKKQVSTKVVAAFFVTLIICVAPLFLPGVAGSNTARLKQVGIFSDRGITQDLDEARAFCSFRVPRILNKVICYSIWNKAIYIPKILISRWVETYSPQYLALEGERGTFFLTVTHYGQFYFILYPFFLAGLAFLCLNYKKLKLPSHTLLLIITGLLISPLPTVIAGEAQKVRVSALLPFIFITIALGVQGVTSYIQDEKIKKLGVVLLTLFLLWNTWSYLVNYYTLHTIKYDYTYQSYLPELFDVLRGYDDKTKILIKPFFSDPIMFYSYYNHLDPAVYQKLAVLGPLEGSGFQHTVGLGRVQVKDDTLENIACEAVTTGEHVIFVTDHTEGSRPVIPVKEIRSENDALVYVYVYDASWYGNKYKEDCAVKK